MEGAPPSVFAMVETTGAEAVEENGQAVLMSRVKELEQLVKKQDQKIGELSQERRKQMEEIVDTSIANWLNRLPNLSEATKASFKQGVDKLAKVSFGLCCLPFYYFFIEILIFYWNATGSQHYQLCLGGDLLRFGGPQAKCQRAGEHAPSAGGKGSQAGGALCQAASFVHSRVLSHAVSHRNQHAKAPARGGS